MSRRVAPPSGMAPPERFRTAGGREIELVEPAAELCRRYLARFPDERERYGDAWEAWCRHDMQHILNWAAEDVDGLTDLDAQLAWLHGVLAARDFPAERLSVGVALAAEVMRERGDEAIAARLGAAAERLPS